MLRTDVAAFDFKVAVASGAGTVVRLKFTAQLVLLLFFCIRIETETAVLASVPHLLAP